MCVACDEGSGIGIEYSLIEVIHDLPALRITHATVEGEGARFHG